MEYINEIVKKVKPFANILIFFCLFTIAFIIIAGTIKYTIPFIIGLIAASILQKPTEFIIKRFNIRGEIAAIISTLIFYVITVSVLVVGVVYFSSEIKDLATEGYDYIYNNGSEISDMLQKSLSGFENIDESILDTLKTNITKFISDMSNYALDFSKGIVNGIINVVSALPYIISVIIFAILSSFVFLKKFIKTIYKFRETCYSHFRNKDSAGYPAERSIRRRINYEEKISSSFNSSSYDIRSYGSLWFQRCSSTCRIYRSSN